MASPEVREEATSLSRPISSLCQVKGIRQVVSDDRTVGDASSHKYGMIQEEEIAPIV